MSKEYDGISTSTIILFFLFLGLTALIIIDWYKKEFEPFVKDRVIPYAKEKYQLLRSRVAQVQ